MTIDLPAALDLRLRALAEHEARGDAPLWPGGPTAATYREGLLRPTGSYVEGLESIDALRGMLARVFAEDVTAEVPQGTLRPGCLYARGTLPEGYLAWEAAMMAQEMSDEELSDVRLVRGAHGLELQSRSITARGTQTVSFVIDEQGLVTWYPGRPGSPVDLGQAMVKLHRPRTNRSAPEP